MLDPNIALQYKGMQLNDPMEQYGKAMALSQMAQQNQYMQQRMDEQNRATGLGQMRGQAYMQSGGDAAKLREMLAANGDYEGVQAHDKSQLDAQESKGKLNKQQLEIAKARNENRSNVAQFIATGGTVQHVMQGIQHLSETDPEAAQFLQAGLQHTPNPTPEQIKQYVSPFIAQGMTAEQFSMPKYEKAGDRLTNVNQFNNAPDIKVGVSPDTLLKEQGDDRRAAQGRAANPYFQFLPTADGYRVGDARTGSISIPPNQVIPASADPALQGAIAGSKNTAEMQTKRDHNMKGIGETIGEAENILWGKGQNGKRAPLPTGSGVGTAIDYAGGLVGASPSGSEQAQQLKALSGALTSKMPRMEGPQSDKDVQMYKEMAALIGDSTVPVARRRAALATVKKLWGKYEKKGAQAPSSGGVKFLGFE